MHTEHKVILFIIIIVMGAAMGYGLARQFRQLNSEELLAQAGRKELFYFETDNDLQRLERREFTPKLSTEHVTEGMYALEVVFPAGGGSLSAWRTFIRNWSGSDVFSFDVYNSEFSPVSLKVSVIDEEDKLFTKEFSLSSGVNNGIVIKISDIAKVINVVQVKQLFMEVKEEKEVVLYFDNMKLEETKGE